METLKTFFVINGRIVKIHVWRASGLLEFGKPMVGKMLIRLCWVLCVSTIGYLGWRNLLTTSDRDFATMAFFNPFIVSAGILFASHLGNFAYLTHKLNRFTKNSPPLSSERMEDWSHIESLYFSTFGSDFLLKFHKYGLKLAFVIFCVGGFILVH
jgi:hypothetical protein